MKARNGFVSNSSTTSFLIYGVVVENLDNLGLTDEEKEDGLSEFLYHKIKQDKLDLEVHTPDGYGSTYIGRSWAGVKDNQTGAQFKTEVEYAIHKLLGKVVKCETHEYAWRDG